MIYYCKLIYSFIFFSNLCLINFCTRLHDFLYDTYKQVIKKVESNDIKSWKGYKPRYVTKDNWALHQ
jgi:hypothetical protein